MNTSFNHTSLTQYVLCLQEAIHATVYRESREPPFNNPGEPYQRAHVIEPDRTEALLPIQNLETSLGEPIHRDLQILIRKWQISRTTEKLYQLPVIFRAYLLGDEQSARLQHPMDLTGIEIPMTVDHHIKGCIRKG